MKPLLSKCLKSSVLNLRFHICLVRLCRKTWFWHQTLCLYQKNNFFPNTFFRCPLGYKLLSVVFIGVTKLEMDPILDDSSSNINFIKVQKLFYSKCVEDNKASKWNTFTSHPSSLLQFKCSPPLRKIVFHKTIISCWTLHYTLSLTDKVRMKICISRITSCYQWTPTLNCSANYIPLSTEELLIKAEFVVQHLWQVGYKFESWGEQNIVLFLFFFSPYRISSKKEQLNIFWNVSNQLHLCKHVFCSENGLTLYLPI